MRRLRLPPLALPAALLPPSLFGLVSDSLDVRVSDLACACRFRPLGGALCSVLASTLVCCLPGYLSVCLSVSQSSIVAHQDTILCARACVVCLFTCLFVGQSAFHCYTHTHTHTHTHQRARTAHIEHANHAHACMVGGYRPQS